MRADDRKRLSKMQQRARKDRIQEQRIRQKNEENMPLLAQSDATEEEPSE